MRGIKRGSVVTVWDETCVVVGDMTLYDPGNNEHSELEDFLETEFNKGDLDGYGYGWGNSKSYGSPKGWVDVYNEQWGIRRMVLCDNVGPRGGCIREWFTVGTNRFGERYLSYGTKPVIVE